MGLDNVRVANLDASQLSTHPRGELVQGEETLERGKQVHQSPTRQSLGVEEAEEL